MRHTESRREKKGCFKVGCFGCGGTSLVLLLVVIVLVALAVLLGRPPRQMAESELVREVPPASRLDGGSATSDRGSTEFPELGPESWSGVPGRVVLDLSMGTFEVVAGEPGGPIRVEGTYDVGSYELTESYETHDDSSWVYRVRFRRKVSWIRHLFGDNAAKNRIRVTLPRDVPLVLEGEVGVGQSSLELGGLWLVATQLEMGVGEHTVRFDEPSPVAMERFEILGSVGELRIVELGNASPGFVDVRARIGEFAVDLRGDWRADASIAVSCGIGECSVRVPDDVAVELDSASVSIGEKNVLALSGLPEPEAGRPTLHLDVSSQVGELRIER
jgi:hypothetical protein